MSQQQLLSRVVEVLETLGIEYMLTGSLASSLQGEPRATHDVDVVVDLRPGHIPDLVRSFPQPRYHVSESAATEAVRTETMFNLIDTTAGDKVDFWILKQEDQFDRSRFARRQRQDLPGLTVSVSSPEDTIVMKLRWARLSGGSLKQMTDAVRIFEIQKARLDLPYIERWVARLDLSDEWRELVARADPL